jgi:hypothetical protein
VNLDSGTVLEALKTALLEASGFNRADQIPPEVVLWTDETSAWEALVANLRASLPILTLGDYNPDQRSGPAIWLRCAAVDLLEDVVLAGIPILYLPGVPRASFRTIEECPAKLQPLMAYQFSGTFFAHKNGKDWTPNAFLASLGVVVEEDQTSKKALRLALPKLALESLESLRAHGRWHAAAFNQLLNPDPERRLLEWLCAPEALQQKLSSEDGVWEAFLSTCRAEFQFDPAEGVLEGAKRLVAQQKRWAVVWQRFLDAPQVFAPLEELLEQAKIPGQGLFDVDPLLYPQDNQTDEDALRLALVALEHSSVAVARDKIFALEKHHAPRRASVWAKLNRAPLALALEPLQRLAVHTAQGLGSGTPTQLALQYQQSLWQADAASLEALGRHVGIEDRAAIETAISALYRPWLEENALVFQGAVRQHGYPVSSPTTISDGTCMVFVDGLRFDVAMRLQTMLQTAGGLVSHDWRFSGLPSVTDTAKPAVSPVVGQFAGGADFKATYNGTKVNADVLRRALSDAGVTILQTNDLSFAGSRAWLELGNLDSLAHNQGLGFLLQLEQRLSEMTEQILALLAAGWSEVHIVTDHGWLLLPGGLPKTELPEHLTEARKGRCARLKPEAQTDLQTLPWHFDPSVRVAVAPGISVFVAGADYEHGGLSVQECVTPMLRVKASTKKRPLRLTKIRWKGLRLNLEISGDIPNTVRLELRAQDTVIARKTIDSSLVSLVVEDDSWLETPALLLVLENETVLYKTSTIIGGDS